MFLPHGNKFHEILRKFSGLVVAEVHGGGLCGLFKHDIENELKSSIKKGFETMVAPVIENSVRTQGGYLAGNLSAVPLQIAFEDIILGKFILDIPQTTCAGEVLPSPYPGITFNLKGSFFTPNVQIEPPFISTVFPTQTPAFDKDVQVCIGEYGM
jgi:hypothetical protein